MNKEKKWIEPFSVDNDADDDFYGCNERTAVVAALLVRFIIT